MFLYDSLRESESNATMAELERLQAFFNELNA